MRAYLILLALTPLSAAVPGVVEPGPDGALPRFWLGHLNDFFGSGLRNGDDFRTAGVVAGGVWRDWVLSVEADMLTDRAADTRTDQVTAYVGRAFAHRRQELGWHVAGWAGLGAEIVRELGFQDTQNVVHHTFNIAEVDLAYDPRGAIRPAVAGSVAAGWMGEVRSLGLPIATGWWGVQTVVAGSQPMDGEGMIEAGPRLVLVGHDGALWFGVRWRARDGQPANTVLASTTAHEGGQFFDTGILATPGAGWGLQVRGTVNPETQSAIGTVGVIARPTGGPRGRQSDVEPDLAVYGGGGLGFQMRWMPWPFQDERRSALVASWRYGTEPEGTLTWASLPGNRVDTADLRFDQWTLGYEEAIRSPRLGQWRVGGFAQGEAGVRSEGLVHQTFGYRLVDRATAPVVDAEAGLRVQYADTVTLGFSWLGWLPFWHEEVPTQRGTVTLLDPGWALGGHVSVHLAW